MLGLSPASTTCWRDILTVLNLLTAIADYELKEQIAYMEAWEQGKIMWFKIVMHDTVCTPLNFN